MVTHGHCRRGSGRESKLRHVAPRTLTCRIECRPYVLRVTDMKEAEAWCAMIESCSSKARKRALAGVPVLVCARTDTRAPELSGNRILSLVPRGQAAQLA